MKYSFFQSNENNSHNHFECEHWTYTNELHNLCILSGFTVDVNFVQFKALKSKKMEIKTAANEISGRIQKIELNGFFGIHCAHAQTNVKLWIGLPSFDF